MKSAHSPLADPMKILTRTELATVLADLNRKAPRSPSTRLGRVVFRLAACCGLRASEIAQLQVGDVYERLPRPHLLIRAGARPRVVPLWWDAGTLTDLTVWKAERIEQGAKPGDPFVASQRAGRVGTALSRHTIRKRFRTACKSLGPARLERLTILDRGRDGHCWPPPAQIRT